MLRAAGSKTRKQTNDMPRISELSNSITSFIDECETVDGCVALFGDVDKQIFDGFEDFPCLRSAAVLTEIEALSKSIFAWIDKDRENTVSVVMSGAGTSGRIAFLCQRRFAELFRHQSLQSEFEKRFSFHYFMAGGDRGLIEAQEHAEDNVQLARNDFDNLFKSNNKNNLIVFIGITCGFSAPYVASQLDYVMNNNKVLKVLIGFNPVELARSTRIEKWDKSFLHVARRLQQRQSDEREQNKARQCFIINPIVGPEAITGSTRMKGGTATKFILDLIMSQTIQLLRSKDSDLASFVAQLARVREHSYEQFKSMTKVFESASQSLKLNKHVYYVGFDALGILALIDASECPPTFGALFTDVRGFVIDGWLTMRNDAGDLSILKETKGKMQYRISVKQFCQDLLPSLSTDDTILFINDCTASIEQQEKLLKLFNTIKSCKSFLISFDVDSKAKQAENNDDDAKYVISVHAAGLLVDNERDKSLIETSCKWLLNVVSTTAWVRAGKVFGNRMIDLGISNNKLYFRAQTIIKEILKAKNVDDETIERCLLQAIYFGCDDKRLCDASVDELKKRSVADHVAAAFETRNKGVKILPTALLLASKRASTIEEAVSLLKSDILRKLVLEAQQR